MQHVAIHTKGLLFIVGCAAGCFIFIMGSPLAHAQSPFSLSLSGNLMPAADIDSGGAQYAYNQFKVEASLLFLNLGYTLTKVDWEQADRLALGNGTNAPWKHLHQITAGTAYMADINERWAYLLVGSANAAFQQAGDDYKNNLADSYQEWMAIAGGQYTFSERWKLLFGAGVQNTDFETVYLPAGGFQWDSGFGLSLSMIFPKETKAQYQSANQKFSAYVDFFPDSSAEIAYAVTPSLKTALQYTLSESDTYRLADDRLVNLKPGRKYLETDAQALNLTVSYTAFNHLTCDIRVAYHFERTLSILDADEKALKKLKGDDSVGGSVTLTYNF